MPASLLKSTAAKLFPERAARYAATRRFAAVRRDENNFVHPDEIADLAAPHDVVSFDFFDTIVTRKIALEEVHAKTAEFGERYARGDDGPLPAGLLAHCRHRYQEAVKARGMASTSRFRNEVDLAEVFDGALAPYIRDADRRRRIIDALIAHEVETEKRVLSVDPGMVAALTALRAAGKTVILVSDMYLAEAHIRSILDHLGIAALFDHVYVSCTVGVTKESGLLFGHVDRELGLEGRPRIHFGDNWNNDVAQPRRMGWEARHYFRRENEETKARLDLEARLGGIDPERALEMLLSDVLPGGPEDTVRMTGAAFSIFARRVLQTAVRGGYDRILFLTRDGTVFHELIRHYIDGSGAAAIMPLPKMEDLAFSRRKGVVLNYPDLEDPAWEGFLNFNVRWLTHAEPTLAAILQTFSVPGGELGLSGDGERLTLNGEDVAGIPLDLLRDRPDLAQPLHAALARRRDMMRDYLDQMDLFDRNEKLMLVDIGYSGTAAKAISEQMFIREAKGQTVASRISMMLMAANRYYQGNLRQLHPRVTMYPGTLIDTRDWTHRAVAANFSWLEPFAVDRNRGSLQDFAQDAEGRILPRFAPGSPAAPGAPDRARLFAAATAYEDALRVARLPEAEADRRMTDRFIRNFLYPDRSAVTAMEGLSHHGGLTEVAEKEVIMRIRPHRMIHDLRACHQQDKWLQGSLRASGLGFLIPLLNRMIGLATR
ncbi:HAD family hydrolase [Aliigemmobacter aestuarii]|uniref:HAD family hydrolase n=1 Tax=Aliigemmobacter aestuarii TaxID=1445661 RepID=A0A4S3MS56_9RHOB|nr:HAD family hydrolase [Gemmobacter aestuarii]THD85378.1 HAD family hydrolase [Gemmobacter aestuarii]